MIAADLDVPVDEVQALTFGVELRAARGRTDTVVEQRERVGATGHLRVV